MKNRVRVATKEKVNEMDYFIYFCKVKNEYT